MTLRFLAMPPRLLSIGVIVIKKVWVVGLQSWILNSEEFIRKLNEINEGLMELERKYCTVRIVVDTATVAFPRSG